MEEEAPSVEVDQLATLSPAMLTMMMTQAGQARVMRTQAGGRGAGGGGGGNSDGDGEADWDGGVAALPAMLELSREEKHRRIRAKANAIRFGAPPPRRK